MTIFDIITMSLITTIPILYTFPMIFAHFSRFKAIKLPTKVIVTNLSTS